MYCKECGKQITADSKFCRYCGTKQDMEYIPVIESIIYDDPKDINVNISFGKKVKSVTDNKEAEIKPDKPKYDESYEQETGATAVGVIVIVINLIVLFSRSSSGRSSSNEFYPIFSIINLIWRIIVTVWVVNIAGRQNRSTGGWGVFAFFIPNLALIIIGLLKKLKGNDDIVAQPQKIIYGNQEVSENGVKNSYDLEYSEGISVNHFDLFMGSHIITRIEYSDGIIGNIMKGKSTGKYFYLNTYKGGLVYCKDKEDCIYQLYQFMNR